MDDELDIEATLRTGKLVEPKRNFWDVITFGMFALLPIILFVLVNTRQFEQELTFWRILWIVYLNGIVGLLIYLLIKGYQNIKALDKIGEFENLENAKYRASNIISKLGWQLRTNQDNYLRALAWNNLGQAQMVTLVFTRTNELLINSLSDDSGTFQRLRFGFSYGSNRENVEEFSTQWSEE